MDIEKELEELGEQGKIVVFEIPGTDTYFVYYGHDPAKAWRHMNRYIPGGCESPPYANMKVAYTCDHLPDLSESVKFWDYVAHYQLEKVELSKFFGKYGAYKLPNGLEVEKWLAAYEEYKEAQHQHWLKMMRPEPTLQASLF